MKKDNYFIKIGIFFIFMFVVAFVFRISYYRPIINSEKLVLNTSLNNDQGYHPKVISFDSEWNGYKYWMAFTPYPKKDETKENPEINASNDMINWDSVTSSNEPLDVPTNPDSRHYNSDTHLLYNPDLNQLELFWRYVDDENNDVTIFKITSKDGKEWTEKEIFLVSYDRSERDYVSPAIMYEKGKYKVWYVDKRKVFYLEKENNKITEPKVLEINYKNNYRTWHLDVIYNEDIKKYEMITCAYQDIEKRQNMNLYYTSSSDNIKWSTPIVVMQPSSDKKLWDSDGLYRSSLLYEDGNYYLFYSGHDVDMNVGIGLMKGQRIDKLKSFN